MLKMSHRLRKSANLYGNTLKSRWGQTGVRKYLQMTISLPITFKSCRFSAKLNHGQRSFIALLVLTPLLTTTPVISHAFTESENIIQNNCRECHGTDGKAKVESWPNLNCQNRGYLYSRLMNLKRDSDHDIDDKVKSLSITEMDAISRYYSEQKCSGAPR